VPTGRFTVVTYISPGAASSVRAKAENFQPAGNWTGTPLPGFRRKTGTIAASATATAPVILPWPRAKAAQVTAHLLSGPGLSSPAAHRNR